VLDLVAQGRPNTAIAAKLGLSQKTIRNHVSNILTKLQVADRARPSCRQGTRAWDSGPGSEDIRRDAMPFGSHILPGAS
jgi:DNA-binding NarL/FixJ family response regulator